MKFLFLKLLLILFFSTNFLFTQNTSSETKEKPKKIIEAILGSDVEAPSLTSIILDASKSRPNNGSLTYEFSFPENFIFSDDYEYDKSETVVTYTAEEVKEPVIRGKKSIKKIITRNQYIEIDLPEIVTQKEFIVVLEIQNHVGMKDIDSLSIVVTPPMNPISNDLGSFDDDESLLTLQNTGDEERVELTETAINESYLTIQPINTRHLKPMEVEIISSLLYNDILAKGNTKVLNPNRQIPREIKLNKLYEKHKIVKDTIITIIEPDTLVYSPKKSFGRRIKDLFKIDIASPDSLDLVQDQSLETLVRADSTVSNQDSALSTTPKKSFGRRIKDLFKIDIASPDSLDLAQDQSLETPVRADSTVSNQDSTSLIAEIDKDQENRLLKLFKSLFKGNGSTSRIDSSGNIDSLSLAEVNLTEEKSVLPKEPKKIALKETAIESIKLDTIPLAIVYDSTFTIDTLVYNEVVDTTFYYNFDCKTDSCAAENAILESVGRVLTWGLNENSELELRYFTVADYFNKDGEYDWVVSKVPMDPETAAQVKYPSTLATSLDGTLYVGVGNTQDVMALRKNQDSEVIISDLVLEDELSNPSGLVIGTNDEIYFSDKNNNRVVVKAGSSYRTLLSLKNNNNNGESEPSYHPSTIRIGPNGALFALYEKDCSVYKLSKREIVTILNPNVVVGLVDLALNNLGEVFVLSSERKKVYKVMSPDAVSVIAGIDRASKGKKIYRRAKSGGGLQFSGRPQNPALMNDFSATKIPFGYPVSLDFDVNNNLYVADDEYGTIRKIDSEGMITTVVGPSEDLKGVSQLRVNQVGNLEIFITQPFKHEIRTIHEEEVSSWVKEIKINHPKYIIRNEGVYGLEPILSESVSTALGKNLPPVKKTIRQRIGSRNKKVTQFVSKNPMFCGLLLLLINQGVAAGLENPPELPPDFPFVP
jgi:hypothetical protein